MGSERDKVNPFELKLFGWMASMLLFMIQFWVYLLLKPIQKDIKTPVLLFKCCDKQKEEKIIQIIYQKRDLKTIHKFCIVLGRIIYFIDI